MADRASVRAGPVWDPLVRITHWGIALAIVVNGLITEGGELVHVWIGYGALALLALRMVWGLLGPAEARFSAFPPDPLAALKHLCGSRAGPHERFRSHNPAGALMAYALWAVLAVVITTGILQQSAPFPDDDHAAFGIAAQADEPNEREDDRERDDDGNDAGEVVEEIHEIAANLLLVLAALHVGGVVFEQRRSGANLVRAMTIGSGTGKTRA